MDNQLDRIRELCAQLLKHPETIPWYEREVLARELEEYLQTLETEKHGEIAPVLLTLAEDVKWDVRRAVARALPHLRTDDFKLIAAKLMGDENRFVRQAMATGMAVKERKARDKNRERSAVDRSIERIESLRRRFGEQAANEIFKVGELYYDALAGPVAHDMNGVLDPINTCVDTIRSALADLRVSDPLIDEALGLMNNRLEFLQRLVDDMRLYSLAVVENAQQLRLAPLLTEARSMARDRLKSQGIAIGADGVDEVPTGIVIEMDRNHMLRAFKNIIRNAYESYPAEAVNRPVHIRAWFAKPDLVAIEIRDEGGGVGERHLERLRTFTFGNSTKRNQGGTGFGLPIARRMVRAHGGDISIESTPGKGTAVKLTIPLQQSEGEEE